jgi:RNA polymerase sigma-70 factor (ECF subfamily)
MDDSALVAEFQRTGDTECLRMLVERYQHQVFRVACSVLGPHATGEAEEIAQEVFVQAYKHLKEFRGESSVSSWLYRIAYNRALDRKRLARYRAHHLPEETLIHLPAADNPQQEILSSEERTQLIRAINALPDLYRSIIYLYYWLDCPLDQISEYLGVPRGTLKSYLARARQRLRKELEK